MKLFLGVCRYEYWMSIKRVGLILTVIAISGMFLLGIIQGGDNLDYNWETAASIVFSQSLFFPVVAGIFAADRAKRDQKLGVMELLRVTELRRGTYILGKYVGVALSMLTLSLGISLVLGLIAFAYGGTIGFILKCLVATVVLQGPSIFFVTAFSLACPLIMPVRVYQILFTGYWFWGNYLNPEAFPSISHTLLNASGRYAWQGIFGVATFGGNTVTLVEALLNITLLFTMAAGALIVMELFLRRQQAKM